MWKKSLPAAIIFYLTQFLVYLAPIVSIVWLFIRPLEGEWLGAAGFLAGTIYVGTLHGLNSWKQQGTPIESVLYRTLFVFLGLFLTLTVVIYGWLTPWKGGWLTRQQVPGTGLTIQLEPVPNEPAITGPPIPA